MSFSQPYLQQFYSIAEQIISNSTPQNTDDVIVGSYMKSNLKPEVVIKILDVWVQNIEKLLNLTLTQNLEDSEKQYGILYKERGITYKEFYYLFSKNISEEKYTEYPVFMFTNTYSEDLKNRRYGDLTYSLEDYVSFISEFDLVPINYIQNKRTAKISLSQIYGHSYCVAKTRSGKTELLKLIVYHLIEQKDKKTSLLILDPHGEVSREIRRFSILNKRRKDFIYLDPAIDSKHSPVFNPFDIRYKDESKLAYVTDSILDAFQQLLRDQIITGNMRRLLRHCIYVLLANKDTTMMDLYILLSAMGRNRNLKNPTFEPDEERLMNFGRIAKDPITKKFFKKGWKDVDARTISAVVERIDGILSHPLVRNFVVGKSSFNLRKYLNKGKIIVVNLDFTKLGNIGSEAIGRLIVSEAQNISAQRNKIEKSKRPRTLIFMDECQRFVSAAIERALSEFGKFNTYLFLAHQYIEQIDDGMVKAMLANTENKIVGRNSAASMGAISSDVAVSQDELMEIKKYQFFVKLGDQDPFVFQSSPILLDKPGNPFYVSEKKAVENIDNYMIKKYYRVIKRVNDNKVNSYELNSKNTQSETGDRPELRITLDPTDF